MTSGLELPVVVQASEDSVSKLDHPSIIEPHIFRAFPEPPSPSDAGPPSRPPIAPKLGTPPLQVPLAGLRPSPPLSSPSSLRCTPPRTPQNRAVPFLSTKRPYLPGRRGPRKPLEAAVRTIYVAQKYVSSRSAAGVSVPRPSGRAILPKTPLFSTISAKNSEPHISVSAAKKNREGSASSRKKADGAS